MSKNYLITKFKQLGAVGLVLILSPSQAKAEQDFATWTRAGAELSREGSPFELQLDGQLRLTGISTKFEAVQTRAFLNYNINKNNTFSVAYLFTRATESITNVAALQYTNDQPLLKSLALETRIRFEERWETELQASKTEQKWRSRLRLGLGYKITEPLELIINDEIFFTELAGFSENRCQAGISYNFSADISLDLFYQNRFLKESDPSTEHTLFTNLQFKIKV